MKSEIPLRVVFDQQIFSSQVYGGISRYFSNLAQQLSYHEEIELKVIAPLYVNSYLKALDSRNVHGIPIPIVPKTGRLRSIINRLAAPIHIKAFHPDIVHETYYSFNAYAPAGARRIVTVYDMIHERYPRIFPQSDTMAAAKSFAIRRADFVICISENTRQDLLNIFDLQEHEVSTVHLGFDFLGQKSNKSRVNAERTPRKPYLFYVGNRHGYKNFAGLLKAYASSALLRTNFHLVCFGGGRFTAGEHNLFSEHSLSADQVTQVGGSDTELARHYRQAAAFIYPSLYEGFGIPLLEAMALDCPVVCSNTSSIPEVAGNAGEYFDPKNPEAIASAIERVVDSSSRRSELINLGGVRCMQFSWKKCAEETLQIYRSIL